MNELLQSDKLQFTLDVWMHNENDENDVRMLDNKTSINRTNMFHFLDMKIIWNES